MNHRLPNNCQPFIESVLSGQTTSIEKKFVPDGKAGDKLRFYSGDDDVDRVVRETMERNWSDPKLLAEKKAGQK